MKVVSKSHDARAQLRSSSSYELTPIVIICVSSFATMMSMMCLETTLLLYMNSVGLTSGADPSFFIKTQAIGFITPIIASSILGQVCVKYGGTNTLAFSYVVVFFGYFIILLSKHNRIGFIFGYICYVISSGFRVIRYSLISDIVPPHQRTFVMAIHQFTVPLGFVCAPVIWLFLQKQKTDIYMYSIALNRFSLNLILCMIITLLIAIMIYSKLKIRNKDEKEEEQVGTLLESNDLNENENKSYESVEITKITKDGKELNANQYKRTRFIFFTILILCTRFTFDMILCIFQPILVGHFKSTDYEMSITYLIIGIVSLLPPLLVAILSSMKLSDRWILLTGVALKLLGSIMYLPLDGTVRKWQVILGYMLVIKASSFCTTSCFSLFSKLLGRLCSAKLIGYLWSASNLIPALVQLTFSKQIVSIFSTWSFVIFIIPTFIALLMIISPPGWELLSESSDLVFS